MSFPSALIATIILRLPWHGKLSRYTQLCLACCLSGLIRAWSKCMLYGHFGGGGGGGSWVR